MFLIQKKKILKILHHLDTFTDSNLFNIYKIIALKNINNKFKEYYAKKIEIKIIISKDI